MGIIMFFKIICISQCVRPTIAQFLFDEVHLVCTHSLFFDVSYHHRIIAKHSSICYRRTGRNLKTRKPFLLLTTHDGRVSKHASILEHKLYVMPSLSIGPISQCRVRKTKQDIISNRILIIQAANGINMIVIGQQIVIDIPSGKRYGGRSKISACTTGLFCAFPCFRIRQYLSDILRVILQTSSPL